MPPTPRKRIDPKVIANLDIIESDPGADEDVKPPYGFIMAGDPEERPLYMTGPDEVDLITLENDGRITELLQQTMTAEDFEYLKSLKTNGRALGNLASRWRAYFQMDPKA